MTKANSNQQKQTRAHWSVVSRAELTSASMVLSGFSFVFWDCLCFSWLPNSSLSTGVFFTKLQFALSPDKALLLQAPWISGKTNWLSSGHLPLLSNHCGQGWARGIRGGKMSHPDPYNVSPREQRGSFTQKGLGVRADKTANVCFLFWVFVLFFFFEFLFSATPCSLCDLTVPNQELYLGAWQSPES